ncbi:ABC transporter substrate-binding protein [Motiliproteus sp. MSK22-1]|uniref:ABC transporter substrate-binding protein n=1 Tax=Motiliproteus sp. MSK22-1 TaxID=1897630 RepID=UPI001180D677|nr:ABC transporter substrate-binding protein [Motiliproteus sp. MSK22-1]
MIKKTLAVSLLTGAMALAGQAQAANTMVYCSEGSPEGFNAALTTSGTTMDASSRQIYNRLSQFKIGTTEVVPGLAESWDVSADGTEYTFHLRKGVDFHTTKYFTPGRQFTADDVLFTFDRQRDEKHPYHDVNGGTYEYFDGMDMGSLIKDIVKIDDYTVKFILNRPEAPFIANLAMDFASILSAEYADQLATSGKQTEMNWKPVGTGPFAFVQYKKDALIRYKAHDSYWGGRQDIDNLVFAITPDASVRYQKVKAGECHLMAYPNPADLGMMAKDSSINLMKREGLNVGYLGYNTVKPPFDNPKVRKALNMAINKDAIIDAVFNGVAQVAKNPLPPTIWSYNDKVVDDSYNPEMAKKMLMDAGVTSLKTNVWAMPVQRPYNPNARRMAELIQADWKKVGVDAEIVTYEWGEYLKRSKAGEHDSVLLGWTGDNGDPDNFLRVLLGCQAANGGANRANWCNKEFDDLLNKALATSDQAERTKLYEQAQLVFKREAPWATIAHSLVFKPVRKEVSGFKIDPLGGHYFEGVTLK